MPLVPTEKKREYNRRYREKHKKTCQEAWRRQGRVYYQRNKEAVIARREQKRAIIREAKNQPCADCGGRFPPVVMDLHHRRDKQFTLGDGGSRSEAAIRAELAKCDVLCANCHRERH